MSRIILEKREKRLRGSEIYIPIISFGITLLLGMIVLSLSKANPFQAYYRMAKQAFGTVRNLQNTIQFTIPLLLCGLSVGVAFRLKFWNIGAEGQMIMGVIGTTWVMQFWTFLPDNGIKLLFSIIMGVMFGAIWGGVTGAMKAYWNVDETLSTLMLNYVAIGIAEYLYMSAWKAPKGNMGTPEFPSGAVLPRVWGTVHAGVFIALGLTVIMWFVLYKTRWGFELTIIGKNSTAARVQGINIKKNIVLAIILSGAIAGLAGSVQSLGVTHRLTKGVDAGYGFSGVIVAWMGGLNPFISIIYAFILAAFKTGANGLQLLGLKPAMGDVMQGLLLIPLLALNVFNEYHIRIKKTNKDIEKAKAKKIKKANKSIGKAKKEVMA